MHRICTWSLTLFVLLGCNRTDFRSRFEPGEREVLERATVYHLADGVFIEERRSGSNVHYLIESTVAGYRLTAEGLDVKLKGEQAGTYSTTPAPQGFVAAWITEVPGEGPGVTRFQINEAALARLLQDFSATTTIRDFYDLKQ